MSFFFALPLLFAAQNAGSAHAPSLSLIAGAYRRVQGYHLESTVTDKRLSGANTVPAPGPDEESVAVYFNAPDLWHISDSSGHLNSIIRDGTEYFDSSRGVTGYSPALGKAKRISLFSQYGAPDYASIGDNALSADPLRKETLETGHAKIPCLVMEVRYPKRKWAWTLNRASFAIEKRTLWVDVRRYVVLREVDLIQGKDWDGSEAMFERTIAVQELTWNERSADRVFATSPAVNSTITPDGPGAPSAVLGSLLPFASACQNLPDVWQRFGCASAVFRKACKNLPADSEVRAAHLIGYETVALTVTDDEVKDVHSIHGAGLSLDAEAVNCVQGIRRYAPLWKGSVITPRHLEISFGPAGVDSDRSFWHLVSVRFDTKVGMTRPFFLKTEYPEMLPNERVKGSEMFHVAAIIGKDGRPREVRLDPPVKSPLADQAVKIVQAWRFRPATRDGAPVEADARFILVFGDLPLNAEYLK